MSGSEDSDARSGDTSERSEAFPNAKFAAGSCVPVTIDELLRLELAGKVAALDRYDTIVWKIRAGYLAVIYGAALLMAGKEAGVLAAASQLKDAAHQLDGFVILSAVLSISVFLVDWFFLRSKLMVVAARNELADWAFRRARNETFGTQDFDDLRRLLQITGEGSRPIALGSLVRGLVPLLFVYVLPPITFYIVVGGLTGRSS